MRIFNKWSDLMSIINDVYQCVRFADKIGQSKKEFRKNDKKHFIHSHSQKKKVLQVGKEFANFCRDNYAVRKLHNVKEENYRNFLAIKHNLTLSHQRTIVSYLHQLKRSMY